MKIQVRRVVAAAIAAAPAAALVTAAPAAQASTVSCAASSLIGAINSAPSGSTVRLTRGCVYKLTTANNSTAGGTGLPVISKKLTIAGNGATITRSTATAFRLFYVAPGGDLTLRWLTLSNGLAAGTLGGGAIYNHGALLAVHTSFVSNASPALSGPSGGAIDNAGNLRVWRSSFRYNSAQEGGGILNQLSASIVNTTFKHNKANVYGGGALVNAAGTMSVKRDTFLHNTGPGGGAIDNDATTTVTDSTFFGNWAGTNGGGAVVNFGTMTIKSSTLFRNTSPYGGNVYNFTGFTMSMESSILAQGSGGGGNCGGGAPVTNVGYNIDTGSSCGFGSTNHSLSNTHPLLEELGQNGGPTQTLGLPPHSAALDKIPASAAGCQGSIDQRYISRPQASACDIGAYEFVVTSGDTQRPSTPTGLRTLKKTAHFVTLRWTRSTDNVGVTRYTVLRNGKPVGYTGGPLATGYRDYTVASSKTYKYQVVAYDGSGNASRWSTPIYVTVP